MPELFKLEKEEFSDKFQEWWWTYLINFNLVFNKKVIEKITVTDYTWTKKGREKITKKLILDIFRERINEEILTPEPQKNPNWKRDHFVLTRIAFDGKKYKLVCWLKMETIIIC